MPRLMRGLAFLLRPGWIALALVVIAFTYLCFMVLAPWQLGKNTRTSRENHQIEYSLNTPPVSLKNLLPQQDSSTSDAQWRRVTATGHYLPDVQVLARLDRGYVRPEQGSHVPPIARPPAETVTITARLRDSEPTVRGKDPFVRDDVQQVYSINTEQVAALTKVPLAGSYLQLVDNQPGGLGVIGVPHLDAGPFLSYGIQWISFGILAPIGLGYFVYSEIRVRRREKQQAAETPVTVEEKLADRYGRRR